MRFMLVPAVLVVVSCGAGDDGAQFVLRGRVVADAAFEQGVAGVAVTCPAAGAETVTDADGYFRLNGTAGEEASGVPARLAVWFEGGGFAPVSKTFIPIRNVESTAMVRLSKALGYQSVAVPKDKQSQAITMGNATITLFHDSLVNLDGALVASGDVDISGATWEPIFSDRETIPAHPVVEPMTGGSNFVEPLVMTRFSASFGGTPLSVGGSQGVGLYMTSLNPVNAPIGMDDGRLFHVDELTGALVEKPVSNLDTQNNVLQASADADGTWVWARDVDKPTCVNLDVSYAGGGAVIGAHARLVEDLGGKNGLTFDESIGAEGGLYCLRGPMGKTMWIQAWLAGVSGIREASQKVLTGAGGDCATGCPKSFTLEFQCDSDAECGAGRVCNGGRCEAAPDDTGQEG